MNEIAKQATADKFLLALKKEHLSKKEAGDCIGIMPAQVSYLFNKHYWSGFGASSWDKVIKWVNSGQGLKEYSEKHGRVLPEKKHIELPPKIISVKPDKDKEWEEWLNTPEGKAKMDNAIILSKHPFFTGKPEPKIEADPLTTPSFMESFIEALKQIPSNVTIQISINENK